jgi:hypothetical protein
VVCSGVGAQKGKQPKGKGKAKAGNGGAGGGPSGKAAAAGSSSGEASTSRGEGSRPSTLPSASAGHRSVVEDAAQAELPSAEAASDTQQTEPQLQPAGGGKKEKERQRKERQRQRRMEEAREALQVAIEAMLDARCVSPLWLSGRYPPFPGEVVVSSCSWQGALTCPVCGCSGESGLGAVEAAMAEAEKHGDRSELLAALVAEAKAMIEQAKTQQAERARAATEEAAAAAAVKAVAEAEAAAERLHAEEEMAAITLRMQSDALRLQQVQARVGSSVVPPAALQDEETLCVLCMDAPKDHIIAPCGHQCVCEACAEKLKKARHALCPFCRTPISATFKVFVV